MPYCTVSDVQALLPGLTLDVGTNPTTANVDTYIALTQADIDVMLMRAGIDAPVDFEATPAPVAQEAVRKLNVLGAAAMTAKAAPSFPQAERTAMQAIYDSSLKSFTTLIPRLDLPTDPQDTEPRGPGVTNVQIAQGPNAPFFRRDQRF